MVNTYSFKLKDRVKFSFEYLKMMCIGVTDDNKCVVFYKYEINDEPVVMYHIYNYDMYEKLFLYIYPAQDPSLLYNRAFSTSDRLLVESLNVTPSSLKEIVGEKLLLSFAPDSLKYANRNIPAIWTIEGLYNKKHKFTIPSVSKTDLDISSMNLYAAILHIEDMYYFMIPLYFLKHEWEVNNE